MKKIKYWVPVVCWCGLIFWLSSFHKIEVSPVSWQDFIIRKTAHFLEYGILSLLVFRGLKNTTQISFKKILWLSFLLAVAYALTDEYHQTLVSGRTGRVFDIMVDTLGSVSGILAIILIKKPSH